MRKNQYKLLFRIDTVEPLIMDTLKSGQPLYNGQTVCVLEGEGVRKREGCVGRGGGEKERGVCVGRGGGEKERGCVLEGEG